MSISLDPFQELDRMAGRPSSMEPTATSSMPDRRWLAHLFDHGELGTIPLADVEETDDAYVVEIELPGIRREDIDIELEGRTLTVSAERTQKERAGILRRRTRVTGRFRYQLTLPTLDDDAEVTASLDDGVLTVRASKPANLRSRRIAVSEARARNS